MSKNFMFLTSTRDIWETMRQTYSKVQDASVIFEVKTKISRTRQGTSTIIEYYNKMKGMWLELDHYQDIKMECSNDIVKLKFKKGT